MATTDKNKRAIEIADFMFANPSMDRANILAKYGEKWQLSVRTMDRLIADAKKINDERISIREEARNKMIAESAKELTEQAILNRDEAAGILSKIAQGGVRDIKDEDGKLLESLVPTDGDRIRAIQQLSKMHGWEAPAQSEIRITNEFEHMTDDEIQNFINNAEGESD